MFKYLNNNKGSALAMVLIIMLVMIILGTALINTAVAENKFAKHHEDKLQAYYIARSGAQAIAEYMLKDANGDAADFIGKTSDWNSQVGGGSFQVTVEDDTVNNVVNIISLGEFNSHQETANIRVTRSSDGVGGIFQYAIAAKNNISVSSNGNQTEIHGSIATKEGTVSIGNAVVTNDIVYDPEMLFPPITLPPNRDPAIAYDEILGNININNSTGPIIASSSSAPKYISAGNIILQNSEFQVTGNGVVHLYVEGNIDLRTNSKFNVANTAKLYIYVSGNRTIKIIGNGAQNNIFLYAPDSHVEWNNAQPNNDFFGSIIANSVELHNQLLIRHNPDMVNDVDLDTSGAGVTFTGYSWID
jgi:hypothetical protein